MNLISWVLSLALLIFILIEAIALYRTTVCRQEAWLKSTELKTRSLLSSPKKDDRIFHLGCKMEVARTQKLILWREVGTGQKHSFTLDLRGSL